jgi:hypothetical protein
MTPEAERERELDVHKVALAKYTAEVERDTAREQRQQLLAAEAEALARASGSYAETPANHMSALEHFDSFGGLSDPVAASRMVSDPAKWPGVKVTTIEELSAHRATEELFYAKGGGRLPNQRSPVEVPAQRPRISREWVDDPDCIYDPASLAMIEQAQRRRP